MQFVSYLVQQFYSTPFQAFSERLAGAISVFEAIKDDKENDERLKEDYAKLIKIGELTNNKVKVSLFKLDMCVNPSNKEFKTTRNKIRFIKDGEFNEDGSERTITLPEDLIQYHLCKAGIEINQIVARNIKPYSDEFKMGEFGDDSGESEFDAIK